MTPKAVKLSISLWRFLWWIYNSNNKHSGDKMKRTNLGNIIFRMAYNH